MNATHTRYEHSLGVAHLAQRSVESLRTKQPALNITAKEVLLVKMAGLCHDMGHGPLSHVFEFVLGTMGVDARHEELSLRLVDAALQSRGLAVDLARLDEPLAEVDPPQQCGGGGRGGSRGGLAIRASTFGYIDDRFQEDHALSPDHVITSRDICFVKECILGEPLPGLQDFVGRPIEKEFLYDVVNNRHSGKDVDKDDYYVRDAAGCGIGEAKMDMLLIESARVAKIQCQIVNCFRCRQRRLRQHERFMDGNGGSNSTGADSGLEPGTHLSLSYPKKYATTVIKFFDRRQELHQTIYTHKTAKSVEYMLCDVLMKAEPTFRIRLPDGQALSIPQAAQNPEAFLKLTDRILDRIEDSDAPGLDEAKNLLERIKYRDLYSCVVNCRLNEESNSEVWEMSDEDIHNELMELVCCAGSQEDDSFIGMDEDDEDKHDNDDPDSALIAMLKENDFIVEMRKIHKGKKAENPVNYVPFFDTRQDERQLRNGAFSLPLAVQIKEEEYATRNTMAYLDKTVRVFSRASTLDANYEDKKKAIRACFKKWFASKGGSESYGPSLSQC
jgi:HD superfamily phosphohydrolase